MTALTKYFYSYVLIVLLLGMIAVSQYYYDLGKIDRPLIPPIIIPGQAIKMIDLGFHSAAASAMWLYTIQYVTESPEKLPQLIENVNSIDPKFSYPYAFAALTLPSFLFPGFPEKAVEIAEKGLREADPDWRIPYYLATTYHIFFHNREKAAFYFDLAARTPGAIDKIKTIASFYGTAPNFREQTKQIWVSIYESSNDDLIKERAQKYITQIELLDMLDKAVYFYFKKYGKYPEKIEDLITSKTLKELPQSPLGSQFYIKAGTVITR